MNQQPTEIFLKDYQTTPFDVETIDLFFDLHEDYTIVKSITKYIQRDHRSEPLVLHGQNLELLSLKLDQTVLEQNQFFIDANQLTIQNVPREFILEVECKIYPQHNKSLEGLYKSSGNFCTQCEAEGFRKITYYYDRPDIMAKYTTTIEADQALYPVLLSNGNCVAQGQLNNGRHWVRWVDPFKKPSYLFALVAGNLKVLKDTYQTMNGRNVSLEIYAIEQDLNKCHFAMQSLKNSMKWDEETFGLEYDLDVYMIVAVGDFNMGAMENKGLNVFNTSAILADQKTSTDEDFRWVEQVIGHEYFHNWTGNRVTCRDWFQLCLKEGLTVFRDQEFSSDMTSRNFVRIEEVKKLRLGQFAEDAGPIAHPARPSSFIEISNFYTQTVYGKGGEICRMIQTVLGKEGFRKGMDQYIARHDGQAVTIEDFIQAMSDGSKKDVSSFLHWYTQSGTPHIKAIGTYDAHNKTYTLKVEQVNKATPDQANKRPLCIPMLTALLGTNGKPMKMQLANSQDPAQEEMLLIWEGNHCEFKFINITEKPVPSLFRGFSAPVTIETNLTKAEKLFLMAHDNDAFNRWDISCELLTEEMLNLIQQRKAGKPLILNPEIVAGLKNTLTDHTLDFYLKALTLTLPKDRELALKMDIVDVEGVTDIIDFVRTTIANELKDILLETFLHTLKSNDKFSLTSDAMSQRFMRTTCLSYLSQTKDPRIQQLIFTLHQDSNNMTDELATFDEITKTKMPGYQDVISAFYQKWQHEALVIDSWFGTLTESAAPSSIDEIIALTQHQAFDITNPNRVRALLGSLANNIGLFHHISGKGYQIIADKIVEIDQFNPQVASKMAKTFSIWRKLDSHRQELVKAQLHKIKNQQKLSNDLSEVISKLL